MSDSSLSWFHYNLLISGFVIGGAALLWKYFSTSYCFIFLGISVFLGFWSPFVLGYAYYITPFGESLMSILHPPAPPHSVVEDSVFLIPEESINRAKAAAASTHFVPELFSVRPIPVMNDNYAFALFPTLPAGAPLSNPMRAEWPTPPQDLGRSPHAAAAAAAAQPLLAACVVDPADPDAVLAALTDVLDAGVVITTILTTHKHWDHAGGNIRLADALVARGFPRPAIIASALDGKYVGVSRAVADGDVVRVGAVDVRVVWAGIHTTGHVVYHASGKLTDKVGGGVARVLTSLGAHGTAPLRSLPDYAARAAPAAAAAGADGGGCVFSGDTVFVGGFGMLFEGKVGAFLATRRAFAALPPNALLYCGHEYAGRLVTMMRGAPGSLPMRLLGAVQYLRSRGESSIPSTVGLELATNPYLRVSDDDLAPYLRSMGGIGQLQERLFKAYSSGE